jgi:hypothetical protein
VFQKIDIDRRFGAREHGTQHCGRGVGVEWGGVEVETLSVECEGAGDGGAGEHGDDFPYFEEVGGGEGEEEEAGCGFWGVAS